MFAEQLVRLDQVTAAEREAARLEAEVARLASDQQAAAAEEADLTAQIEQTNARFAQEIAETLRETRGQFLSVEEKLHATQDVLDRSVIRAPVSGQVLNLNFATIGGVVRPGEVMMEIIPAASGIAATIRISPTDRASVYEGQTVRTQLAAYRSWSAPRLAGEVIGVSADLKTDPATSAVYYEARIIVQGPEAERVKDLDIEPGMPVDVFIYSGRSRTFLDYVIEPLGESLFRGLRSS
jgi:HlyD family type I secretion membrane fusion protein